MLSAGTKLGPYEIAAPIGAGGMGEVYRATDTTLGRQVAIKILPDAFAADPERLARFEREAKTLASLNHPHIAAIYAVEEGPAEAGHHVRALVMELVEGEDLSQKLEGLRAKGTGLPLDEALPIAKQIAEALEAAHGQGVIHRDLKPANIKVRADGTVKVLDFGLAKAMEAGGVGQVGGAGREGLSMSPTMMSPALMSGVGVILGTAAYMSPEQARGKPVDKRADIWAFGCVLFEMLTGRRPFDGEDMTEVLGAVVRLEPPWDTLPSDVPPPVRTLLHSCLTKDPRQRVADISIALFVLDKAGSLAAPAVMASAGPAVSPAPGGRLAWVAFATALLAAVALAIPALRYLRQAPPPTLPETRTDIVTPATTDPVSLALSPDGRQIVFVASADGVSRLWLRSLADTTAQPLSGTEDAIYPFWSSDSRSVGFFAGGSLKRLDIGGGAPQTLARAVGPRGGAWNADGVVLFTPNTASPLFRVPASGGEAVVVTKLDRQISHRFPSFLPDGRQFLSYAQGTAETGGVYLGALDSADTRRLTTADALGGYLPSGTGPAGALREGGWLLWVRAGTLVAQRLDLEQKVLTGNPVTLADALVVESTSFVGAVSVSASGLVAYRTGGATRRQLARFDRSGKALGTMGAPDDTGQLSVSVSPDGHRAAVFRSVQANTDIWLLDGTRTSRFTFDAALDRYPIWSPDGSRIAFDSSRTGRRNLYQKSSSGAGAEDLLVESPQDKMANDWSADGRFLLYHSIDPQTGRDLWVLPMNADRKPWVFLKTPFEERAAQFSPDGHWVAYMSNESGRDEIYIRAFAAPASSGATTGPVRGVRLQPDPTGGQWQVSTTGGIFPRWRSDGKELYYIGSTGEMMAAPITATGTTVAPGAPVALFPTRIVGGGADIQLGRQYDVTRDGRFLINTVLDSAASPITLLMNWHPEAKK